MLNKFDKHSLRNAQYLEVMAQLTSRFQNFNNNHRDCVSSEGTYEEPFRAIDTITHRDWPAAVATLAAAVQKLDQDFKQQQGSDITAQITEADQKRDKAYQTFAAIIKAQALAEVPNAKKIQKILDKYKLVVTMQMDEENAIIKQIHDDINELGYEKLLDLGVTDHWAKVISCTHVLSEYLRQRDDERATLQLGLVKADRADIDAAYDRVAAILNAALIYEPSQPLNDAVAQLNSYINRIRTQMLGTSVAESEEVSGATPDASQSSSSGFDPDAAPAPSPTNPIPDGPAEI